MYLYMCMFILMYAHIITSVVYKHTISINIIYIQIAILRHMVLDCFPARDFCSPLMDLVGEPSISPKLPTGNTFVRAKNVPSL